MFSTKSLLPPDDIITTCDIIATCDLIAAYYIIMIIIIFGIIYYYGMLGCDQILIVVGLLGYPNAFRYILYIIIEVVNICLYLGCLLFVAIYYNVYIYIYSDTIVLI